MVETLNISRSNVATPQLAARFRESFRTNVATPQLAVKRLAVTPLTSARRQLKLCVENVEIRFHRRSRTSSALIRRPAHFVYAIRCEWSGNLRDGPAFGSLENQQDCNDGSRNWWDSLPCSYVVSRRWNDIQRFHENLGNFVSKRLKERMPTLPEKGDLDKFLQTVAATGDALVMNRPGGLAKLAIQDQGPYEDLELLRAIYVDRRLNPYFAELSKVIAEIPSHSLQDFKALLQFVTSGVSCRQNSPRPDSAIAERKTKFFGPGPTLLSDAEVRALAASVESPRSPSPGSPKDEDQRALLSPSARGFSRRAVTATKSMITMPSMTAMPSIAVSPSGSPVGDCSPKAASWGPAAVEAHHNPPRIGMASSHYSFFAGKTHANDFGCNSQLDFWNRLVVKERKAIGLGALIKADLRASSSSSWKRLPNLPPPGVRDQFRASQEPWTGSLAMRKPRDLPRKAALACSSKILQTRDPEGLEQVIRRDICEGLGVLALGDPAPQGTRRSRLNEAAVQRGPPTQEETQKVYRLYFSLLAMEGASPAPPLPTDEELLAGTVPTKELTRIKWSTLLDWAQQRDDLSVDFRYRSVCAALNRGLNQWYEVLAEHDRHSGLPLSQFFEWLWPLTTPDTYAKMMKWICLLEIDKIRQPTPAIIDEKERRMLEGIFRQLDKTGSGCCSVQDILGKIDDEQAPLQVQQDVYKEMEIADDEGIDLPRFLELMCPDNQRAHKHSTKVMAENGRHLVLQHFAAVDVSVWVLELVPEKEEDQRQLIKALEVEVLRLQETVTRPICAESQRTLKDALMS